MSDIKFDSYSLSIILEYLDLSELCKSIPDSFKKKKKIISNILLKRIDNLKNLSENEILNGNLDSYRFMFILIGEYFEDIIDMESKKNINILYDNISEYLDMALDSGRYSSKKIFVIDKYYNFFKLEDPDYLNIFIIKSVSLNKWKKILSNLEVEDICYLLDNM
jgi:hypothetical protein